MNHKMHKYIGDMVNAVRLPKESKIIKDPACDGSLYHKQHIPLFCSKEKSNETEYCNVDLLIVRNNRIKVIIEIEETNIKPTQICGKYLTSALSSYYIHRYDQYQQIGMDKSVLFIQILDTSKLKDKTSKIKQWDFLKKAIQNICPIKGSYIDKYELFYGNMSGNNSNFIGKRGKGIINCIENFLNRD